MKLRNRDLAQTKFIMSHIEPDQHPQTQVTLVTENISLPPFTGTGSESVQAFLRRVNDECTRRAAHTDKEKLAILKARICYEPSSLAGKLVKSDKFLQISEYTAFTDALKSHFSGYSKLGATHSLFKVTQTLV